MTALLGQPNRYGEYRGFVCPRCGESRTHAVPALNIWRCWACDQFGTVAHLLALPRRPSLASSGGRPELPRRRTTSVPTRFVAATPIRGTLSRRQAS